MGWKVLRLATAAALALVVIEGITNVIDAEPGLRPGVAMFMFGLVVFSGIVLYGVWERARWALWIGGAVSALLLLSVPFLLLAALQSKGFPVTPLSIGLTIVQCLACGAFLAGIVLLRQEEQPSDGAGSN
jgi:hypothetical protein